MSLLTLPLPIYELILQYVNVRMSSLRALQKSTVQVFEKTYVPQFFVSLTRPMRLGGRLSSGPHGTSFDETSMTNTTLILSVDVPIDWAGAQQESRPLPERLLAILPGPPRLWRTGATIVGLAMKKPRGTSRELVAALQTCLFDQPTRYVSIADNRLPKHLPHSVYEGQLAVLHQVGTPSHDLLAKLELFKTPPAALCFHRSCTCFLSWAANHASKARHVECLGDVVLTPEGLQGGWGALTTPCPHVTKIGLSISTGRYSERAQSWVSLVVADVIMKMFPSLRTVGLNLEVSYESAMSHQTSIMNLLAVFTNASISILSFEVLLIQLPSNPKKRDKRLQSLLGGLRAVGVDVTKPPHARSTKEVPCDGFLIPASLSLCAPAVVSRAVSSALWQTVW